LIRQEFSERVNKFYRKPVFWSGSYSVISAGGAPLEVLKKYIRNQEEPSS
jgi:putative transposase